MAGRCLGTRRTADRPPTTHRSLRHRSQTNPSSRHRCLQTKNKTHTRAVTFSGAPKLILVQWAKRNSAAARRRHRNAAESRCRIPRVLTASPRFNETAEQERPHGHAFLVEKVA